LPAVHIAAVTSAQSLLLYGIVHGTCRRYKPAQEPKGSAIRQPTDSAIHNAEQHSPALPQADHISSGKFQKPLVLAMQIIKAGPPQSSLAQKD
jgi:hypothetical protein